MTRTHILHRHTRGLVVAACAAVMALTIGASAARAELAFAPNGVSVTTTTEQAGAHPDLTTNIELAVNPDGNTEGDMRNVTVDLPVGFAGYTKAVPSCEPRLMYGNPLGGGNCPASTQVGTATVVFNGRVPTVPGFVFYQHVPVYNVKPAPGQTAEFSFNVFGDVTNMISSVRPGDYGLETKIVNISEVPVIYSTSVTLWGVPADPSHDALRGASCIGLGRECTPKGGGATDETGLLPLLRNPTRCTGSPLSATVDVESWPAPGQPLTATTPVETVTGCEALQFNPTISVQPGQSTPDTPSGYTVVLKTPQSPSVSSLATSDLRNAVVKLPAGVVLSPSAADGLEDCTDKQVGLGESTAPACPAGSRIGTATLRTPALSEPMDGSIYLAGPETGSITSPPYRIFLTLAGEGVRIKQVGTVTPDPKTGQLTTTFEDNPQQPFTELTMKFNDGPRASLATPSTCGTFTTTSELTPWSGNATATPTSAFTISGCRNPDTFAPSFSAGTANPQAGAYSAFTVTLSRSDADQTFNGLTATLPPGLLGKLAGIPLCPEANANAGTCPADSQVGTVEAAAGPGSHPYWLSGTAYLTGPYNGGPYGLAVEVPAVAGPFNLGTVVVRNSIRINPSTAQVTVVSDPFPTIIGGIPIQLRTVNVTMNRPEFMVNPTSCEPMAVDGAVTSTGGLTADVSNRFQAGGCAALAFKPKFSVLIHKHHTRKNGAYMHVVVESGAGQANIHKVDVQLPKALAVRDETLKQACSEAQFATNPAGCPAGSFVGTAVAKTPILAKALTGPAIFVSHAGKEFPNMDLVLQGEGVTIVLTSNTFVSKKGYTFSRFESVPDAPVSRFSLVLPAGPHSALAGNGNLCYRKIVKRKRVRVRRHGHVVKRRGHLLHKVKKIHRRKRRKLLMPTTITGQNGAVLRKQTKLMVQGCAGGKAKASRAGHKHRHHRHHGHK